MIVVSACDYARQRRENLFRMHRLLQENDHEADALVLSTARNLKMLWQMKDLFPHVPLAQDRVFRVLTRSVLTKGLRNRSPFLCP